MSGTLTDLPATCEGRPRAGPSFPAEEALIEEARQHQRRRWRRLGVLCASLVVLAAAVAGAVGLSGRTGRTPTGGQPSAPPAPAVAMPSRVVVWTDNFRIEVLSSRTGRVIRTLATNVALNQGLPTLAVSAAGVLYFDDARGIREYVLSVPLAGGPVATVGQGTNPALSPDGRLLAYVTYANRRCLSGPCTASAEAIVVRDLSTGTQKIWAFTSIDNIMTNLSWSKDSRFLAFAGLTYVKNGTVTVRTAQVLDTRSGGSLDSARRIPLSQRVAWAGYLTSNTGVGVLVGQHGDIQASGGLVEVGVGSGRIFRRLTSLPPGGLGVSNGIDGTENTIAVDRSGHYLLFAGGPGRGEIFRWTFGMRRPVPVPATSGALRAVWAG